MASGDLNGQKINHWTVLEDLGGGRIVCQCDCENKTIKELYKKAIVNGRSKSCGCVRENSGIHVGDIFYDWKVLEKRPDRMVLCQCSCGELREVFEGSLKSGKSKSCGNRNRHKDIIKKHKETIKMQPKAVVTNGLEGQIFGDWKVIEKLNKDKALCQCMACGKQLEVYISNLKRGRSKSCGCQNDKYRKIANDNTFNNYYMHEKFGFLEIIGRGTKEGYALCKCICGKEKEVRIQNLNKGMTRSCGCKSKELHDVTMMEEYGDIANNKTTIRELWQIEAVRSKLGLQKFIESLQYKPQVWQLCQLLDLQEARMLELVHRYGLEGYIDWNRNQSLAENGLYDFISNTCSFDIIRHCRDIIDNCEIDIYIPALKLGIEYNGNYWHSTKKVDSNYHINKTNKFKEKNIRLVHIFEYEWLNNKDKIKMYIKQLILHCSNTLYARNTQVYELNSLQAKIFLDKYHLQGYSTSSVNIGLIANNEIVGILTLGKPRFNNEYEYEIIRLCFKNDIKIVGGTEKMLSYFLKNYNPKNVISYCDIGKFKGDVYERVGFKLRGISKPNYKWVKGTEVLSRYQTQKEKLVQLGMGIVEQTEDEIMDNNKYLKIYDCGNYVYEYINQEA